MIYLKHKASSFALYSFIAFIFLFVSGCNNETNVAPGTDNNISVSYFNQNNTSDNTLVLTEAKFILRKIVLEQEGEGGDHGGDRDVKMGPFVVNLDLNQKIVIAALAKIQAGSYDEVKFQIHKLSPNEDVADPEFAESTSRRFSVIVKGFYNDAPFIFKSDVTFAKEIEFENFPLSVSDVTVLNITIKLDVFSWFTGENGILNPADPANLHIINQNIRNDFRRAFRDMNHDGDPD
jgi:hypothetical protein